MQIKVEVVPDGTDDQGRPIFVSLDEAISQEFLQRIEKLCDAKAEELIEKAVVDLVANRVHALIDAAFAKPIQRTNRYGDPIDKPIPLAELVADLAKNYMQEEVGSDGRTDSYSSRDTRVSRLQWTAARAGKDLVEKVLAEQVKQFRDSAAKAVGEQVVEVLAAKFPK